MKVTASHEVWPLAGTFTISRGSRTQTDVVVVEIADGAHRGIAECVPYARYGESIDGVIDTINSFAAANTDGFDRSQLATALEAGAARNALDCALWDLEAKSSGRRAWELAGISAPEPAITVYTLSLDTPEAMGRNAIAHADRPALKIKLGPDNALECIKAVHAGAPDASLVVDANEAWNIAELTAAMPELAQCGVILVEQPLPADADHALADIEHHVPIAADESCHVRADVDRLVDRYDVVNIKLDKTGGLTEALLLKQAAVDAGLGIMVGCMMSTSLAMAPATLLTKDALVTDLDGPLWLKKDREPALPYRDHQVCAPAKKLWG